eukprot:6577410-Prymnesium_polylepis.2
MSHPQGSGSLAQGREENIMSSALRMCAVSRERVALPVLLAFVCRTSALRRAVCARRARGRLYVVCGGGEREEQ